jgi:phenylalanyl-tRNA synthetase alpha chain
MDPDLETVVAQARQRIGAATEEAQLADAKAAFLGKAGALTGMMRSLASLAGEAKARRGQALNQAKQKVEALLTQRTAELREAVLQQKLAAERIDVTLPGRGLGTGGLHPISLTIARIEDIFRSIGFDVADGPEIEQDFYNFTALNMPADHPARSMHDTFYVAPPKRQRTDRNRSCCAPIPVRCRYGMHAAIRPRSR